MSTDVNKRGRGRPTARKRNPLSGAVIALRAAFGETQEQFADRLEIGLNTLARYETSRPPSGTVLDNLAQVAHGAGRADLAATFADAAARDRQTSSFNDPVFQSALSALFHNRGSKWLESELRKLIREARSSRAELQYPEIFNESGDFDTELQIEYLKSILNDIVATKEAK